MESSIQPAKLGSDVERCKGIEVSTTHHPSLEKNVSQNQDPWWLLHLVEPDAGFVWNDVNMSDVVRGFRSFLRETGPRKTTPPTYQFRVSGS